MSLLQPGQMAPDFELPDQENIMTKLSKLHGIKVFIYFYPRANTPGCVTQACIIRDSSQILKSKGVIPIGISPDTVKRQDKFAKKHSLGFKLLADTEHKVAEAYGVWDKKSIYGKLFFGIIRSSFLINEDGVLTHAWYKVAPKETVSNVLNALTDFY
ncbi:thioredoxin-dependent thiol peroxidase [Lentisphaerota bacterium ZTH]|nr:thioredoxin-dependent thiol peroxidase [Lentisphaerota bacterium]WET07099.1 thioredoxin-dependent thiol peroxidase [Lentisphaerota bacterium ZTH]